MTADTDFNSKLEALEAAMSVLTPDSGVQNTYQRIALISHPRHLDQLDSADASLLVVATEWLAWWEGKERGYSILHYENRLAPWPEGLGNPDDLYIKACDWVYADAKDMTEYKSVSLGYLFGSPTALAWVAYCRLEFALSEICRDVQAEELILFDLSSHFSLLGAAEKRQLASDLAQRNEMTLTDRFDPMTPGDPNNPTVPLFTGSGVETGVRPWLRKVYGILIDSVSHVAWWLHGRRPKIFFFISHMAGLRLIDNFRGHRIAPVFLAGTLPKNLKFLWNCWRRGVILAHLPGARRWRRGGAVQSILQTIEGHWNRSEAKGAEAARRTFIRTRLIESGRIYTLADMVDQFDRLIDRHQVQRVVSGDVSNPAGRAICTLANAMGIPSDETLNGMFLTNLKDPSRCGDAFKGATVSRELVHGDIAVEWLNATGATSASVQHAITGYPTIDAVRQRFATEPRDSKRRNALVLPSYAHLTDVSALHAEIVPFLINSVRVLAHQGFDTIRIKIHPGGENRHFYKGLIDRFEVPATVHDDGNFLDHLDWTDIVVGPATTGALVETLAASKPYYIFRSSFSAVPESYLRSATVVSSAAGLNAVLSSGTEPDIDAILQDFCATHTISSASERMWQVLEDSTAPQHPAAIATETPVFETERPATK